MTYLTRFQMFSRLKYSPFAFSTLDYAYLRRCAWLSLSKRWGWIAAVALFGLALGLAVSVGTALLTAVLSAAEMVLGVAIHSALRHRTDWKARRNHDTPFLRRL